MATIKTDRMRQIEAQWGEPLEQLIPRLYQEENRRLTRVARRLGISYGTLFAFIGRLGLAIDQNVIRVA